MLVGASFSFQLGIDKNRASIPDNWMRKIEWYKYAYGLLMNQTKEAEKGSAQAYRRSRKCADRALMRTHSEGRINSMLYLHSIHNWGDMSEVRRTMIDKGR